MGLISSDAAGVKSRQQRAKNLLDGVRTTRHAAEHAPIFEDEERLDQLAGCNVITLRPRATLARQFCMAVRAAVAAYAKSGRMLDAALAYAAHGVPVVACSVITKVPIAPRDPDPTGKFPDGISGTGGIYKATTDPIQIHEWWRQGEYLIAVPMGERSGVWCLDIDTSEDHADGVAAWNEIAAEHEPIVTREHRSATDGPHLIFAWEPEQPIRCSKGALPEGIEIKGEGGYIIVPPSRRKGRNYTVFAERDPIKPPQFLLDLILQGRSPSSTAPNNQPDETIDLNELAEIVSFIPNRERDWTEFKNMAMRVFASASDKDEAFKIFQSWSRRWPEYDPIHSPAEDEKCWQEVTGSPPDRTGIGKLRAMARAHGWMQKAQPIQIADEISADEARQKTRQLIDGFLDNVIKGLNSPWRAFVAQGSGPEPPAVARALRTPTGIGKTELTTEATAERSEKLGGVIYATPTHKLNARIDEQFSGHGIVVRVFRGREADDPENKGKKMCLNLPVVELAQQMGASITETCCKKGDKVCKYIGRCGYYRQQKNAKEVQVWIVAHSMLFHYHRVFGEPVAVIIDESFWETGLRGIHKDDKCVLSLDSIAAAKKIENGTLAMLREALGDALKHQKDDGGVERQNLLDFITARECSRAIQLEWECMPKITIEPGMSKQEIHALGIDGNAIKRARQMVRIWREVRDLLEDDEIEVSGRVTLLHENDVRCLQLREVRDIGKKFNVPTLLLDATLPRQEILRVYHPGVKIAADIRVAMPPHVRIRQVLHAPTSANKLQSERHLLSMRRYILRRWLETGCKETLVVCQMQAEKYLRNSGLPESIKVEHYNNVAGIDDYKDARLLILIGRTAPGPEAMEMQAGILSGKQPMQAKPGPTGFIWHGREWRGIHLRDGSGCATEIDRHVDDFVESVRWQVHEGELIQALGRGRGINRTPENPLDIDLLFDTCLPIKVDTVTNWERPSLLIDTAAKDGVMLTSPVDMVQLWPEVWPNTRAADRTLEQGVPNLPGFVRMSYQPTGAKMKPRDGYFDPSRSPDPKAWMKSASSVL